MSQDINNVVLIGRLVRDAELRYTSIGAPVTRFSIAVNERKKDGDSYVDKANFIDVTFWGKLGETLSSYLVKGKQIAVVGKLNQQRWEKDGYKHSKIVVVANTVQLLSGKRSDPEGSGQSDQQQDTTENFDDDIPFF